jgi:DNA-binding NarL/FixJ family response regulator
MLMLNSSIVWKLHDKAKEKDGPAIVTDWDWEYLTFQFRKRMPDFNSIMEGGTRALSLMEQRVCMLLLLGFKNKELAALLHVTPQRITNIRRRINSKLFDDASSKVRRIRRAMTICKY